MQTIQHKLISVSAIPDSPKFWENGLLRIEQNFIYKSFEYGNVGDVFFNLYDHGFPPLSYDSSYNYKDTLVINVNGHKFDTRRYRRVSSEKVIMYSKMEYQDLTQLSQNRHIFLKTLKREIQIKKSNLW